MNDVSGEFAANDVSAEFDDSNIETIEDFVQMLHFNEADVQQNAFAIIEIVVSAEVCAKLGSIVKRYIEIYAEDLKSSSAEYLVAVKHWRHLCEMTELLPLWIISTLQCKVRDLLAVTVMHMVTSGLKANNVIY